MIWDAPGDADVRRRLAEMAGELGRPDLAKGIKTFKAGMKEDEDAAAKPADGSKPIADAGQKPAATQQGSKAAG